MVDSCLHDIGPSEAKTQRLGEKNPFMLKVVKQRPLCWEVIRWEFDLRERDGAETQPGMSALTRTLPDSSVQPFFLQPADVGQDPSVMRAFEGRKNKDNGLPMLHGSIWGRGGLILMTCIREEKVWFLWLTLERNVRWETESQKGRETWILKISGLL